jgi:hypothetical protein
MVHPHLQAVRMNATLIVTAAMALVLANPVGAAADEIRVWTARVSSQSQVPKAASELITFLSRPKAIAVMKAQGMEPR